MNNGIQVPHARRLELKLSYLGRLWKNRFLKINNARLCKDLGITLDELFAAQKLLHGKTMRVYARPLTSRYDLQSRIVPR